jgi:hypothetical protein
MASATELLDDSNDVLTKIHTKEACVYGAEHTTPRRRLEREVSAKKSPPS